MKIRPEVMKFAEAMERKLRENENKGGWKDCTYDYLMGRVDEELEELQSTSLGMRRFLDEAADIANFLMMLCDVAGHLDA